MHARVINFIVWIPHVKKLCHVVFIPHSDSDGMLWYTFSCLFLRPCSPFLIDNLSIVIRERISSDFVYTLLLGREFHRILCTHCYRGENFFRFCVHIVIGDECYGIVNGHNHDA